MKSFVFVFHTSQHHGEEMKENEMVGKVRRIGGSGKCKLKERVNVEDLVVDETIVLI